MAIKTKGIVIPRLILLALFSFFFIACSNNLCYETFEKVNVEGWDYKNEKRFSIPVQQTEKKEVTIAIRNTGNYERANLWLFLTVKSPEGNIVKDTINCPLADDYGYWLGSGFSGLYLTEHTLKSNNYCTEKGNWEITLTHGMRQDTIKGIQEIGVLVRKIEE